MRPEEKLFDAIGHIDEQMLLESEKSRNNKRLWLWIPTAACVCLVAIGSATLLPVPQGNNSGISENMEWSSTELAPSSGQEFHPEADLPMLTITEDLSSMGFEGYMAYDISELVNGNPWNETANISYLPVYRNQLAYDEYGYVPGSDFGQMEEFLLEIAERLGMRFAITDDTPDEKTQQTIIDKFSSIGESVPSGYFDPSKLIGKDKGMTLEVDESMTAKISFDPAVALPDGYNFTHFASYDECSAVAGFLEEEYQNLIAMDNPQRNIYGGDYTIYNQQQYHIEFFDGSGDLTEQIINYNFNRVAFYCNDDGKLFLARVFHPDLSEKTGDYPVITAEEATELLLNGSYMTTVPWDMPGKEYIMKTELIYRTDMTQTYLMPYYRFYIELPEAQTESGLTTYGAYYVPAVSQEYISNMPVNGVLPSNVW